MEGIMLCCVSGPRLTNTGFNWSEVDPPWRLIDYDRPFIFATVYDHRAIAVAHEMSKWKAGLIIDSLHQMRVILERTRASDLHRTIPLYRSCCEERDGWGAGKYCSPVRARKEECPSLPASISSEIIHQQRLVPSTHPSSYYLFVRPRTEGQFG